MTQLTETGQVLDHPAFGRLQIVDDSDPSLLTVRNKNANTFKIGKLAAGWNVPDYVQGIRAPAKTNGTIQSIRREPMNAKVIEFVVERETKNTVRYEEQTEGQPPSVGTLYVQKWALGSPVPQKLKITIESGD